MRCHLSFNLNVHIHTASVLIVYCIYACMVLAAGRLHVIKPVKYQVSIIMYKYNISTSPQL